MEGKIINGNIVLKYSQKIVFFYASKKGESCCPTCGLETTGAETGVSHWGDCWDCWHEKGNLSSSAYHDLVVHKGGEKGKDYVWLPAEMPVIV